MFPGSAAQWNGLTDMTDARCLRDIIRVGFNVARRAQ